MQLQRKLKNNVILLTSANYFTIAKFRYSFISKLIADGHKVILYSSYDDMSYGSIKRLEALGAICIKTGSGRGSYSIFEAFKYIAGYIDSLAKYSVNITINFTLMPMVFGGIVCRIKKLKYVSVVTGLGSQYHGNSIKRWLLKFAYSLGVKHANQIWFVSRSDARIGVDKLHINPNKIKVVYGAGVKTSVNNSPIDKTNTSCKTQVIYMGRIREDKGIEDFIALADRLSLSNKFSMVLMGSMDSSDEKINFLVNKARKDGLITRIDFDYDNMKKLRSADVLLLCSRHEGMPTVILEAMSNFVIPLAANIPVIEELNNMGAKIYSYVAGELDSLYEEIIKIDKMTLDEKEKVLTHNHEFVSKYFNQDKIAKLQYKYLSRLLD